MYVFNYNFQAIYKWPHLIISVLRYYCLLRIFFIKLRDKDVRAGNNPKNYTQIFQTLNLQTI